MITSPYGASKQPVSRNGFLLPSSDLSIFMNFLFAYLNIQGKRILSQILPGGRDHIPRHGSALLRDKTTNSGLHDIE